MSVGGAASNSKTTSSGNTNGTQAQTGTQTPNNLPYLQQGWNAASSTLGPTTGLLPSLSNSAAQSAAGAAVPATNLAATGANAASSIATGANGPNAANQYLTPFANGSMVNSTNPSFQDLLHQFANQAQAATDGSFAADGRYGSGANANAFNSAVANEAGQLSYTNYAQQQQNQLAAAGQLSNNNANSTQQQLAAQGLIPALTSNLFTPSTSLNTAAYGPLLAYINAIAASNGGGTQTSNTNYNQNTHNVSNTTAENVNASATL